MNASESNEHSNSKMEKERCKTHIVTMIIVVVIQLLFRRVSIMTLAIENACRRFHIKRLYTLENKQEKCLQIFFVQ